MIGSGSIRCYLWGDAVCRSIKIHTFTGDVWGYYVVDGWYLEAVLSLVIWCSDIRALKEFVGGPKWISSQLVHHVFGIYGQREINKVIIRIVFANGYKPYFEAPPTVPRLFIEMQRSAARNLIPQLVTAKWFIIVHHTQQWPQSECETVLHACQSIGWIISHMQYLWAILSH